MSPLLPHDAGEDLDAHFAGLTAARALLLAVSGGPDSMALMHLAARWASRGSDRPRLHVATVDHGLRAAARHEAEMVAGAANDLGLSHKTLVWTGPKPESRIQETARAARYALLTGHARAIGATHVVTAHHADDQAETVLLRLGRGSGIGGLAGMRRVAPLAGLWLARPLLDLAKSDLVRFCHDDAIEFIEDPTNSDPAFARTRLREEAAVLARLGLDAPGLARFAARMARADAALEAEADRVETDLRPIRAIGHYEVALTGRNDMAAEIALRLVRRAVVHVAGEAQVRLERLEVLTEALWDALGAGRAHRATLAGTLVRLDRDGQLNVSHESVRRRGRTEGPD